MQVEQPEIAAELAHGLDAVAQRLREATVVYFPFAGYLAPVIATVAGDPSAFTAADGEGYAGSGDEDLPDVWI